MSGPDKSGIIAKITISELKVDIGPGWRDNTVASRRTSVTSQTNVMVPVVLDAQRPLPVCPSPKICVNPSEL